MHKLKRQSAYLSCMRSIRKSHFWYLLEEFRSQESLFIFAEWRIHEFNLRADFVMKPNHHYELNGLQLSLEWAHFLLNIHSLLACLSFLGLFLLQHLPSFLRSNLLSYQTIQIIHLIKVCKVPILYTVTPSNRFIWCIPILETTFVAALFSIESVWNLGEFILRCRTLFALTVASSSVSKTTTTMDEVISCL